jgi:carbonic anhydrase
MKTKLLVCAAAICLAVPAGAEQHPQGIPAADAMAKLMEGNQRYATHREQHPDASLQRRADLTKGQHPYAVIVGCADSRVPPELIFDAGLGDLFVIREAGNVVDDVVLGSVEYAVEHLGVKLVMVMGHELCGAVTAAVNHAREGHVTKIVKLIEPVLAEAKRQPGDPVHNCVLANAKYVARQIRESRPVLEKLVKEGAVKVAAAVYEIDSGRVKLLD